MMTRCDADGTRGFDTTTGLRAATHIDARRDAFARATG